MSSRYQGKWKKKIVPKRSIDDRLGNNNYNYDIIISSEFEECHKLLESWNYILHEFCDESGVPPSRDLDPTDDLQQFLTSIGIHDDPPRTDISNVNNNSDQQVDARNGNNNRKNDNNNNDCDKDVAENVATSKQSSEKTNTKMDKNSDLFKNSIIVSKSKMDKLRETLINSERTIRKIIELKRPESSDVYEEDIPFGNHKEEFELKKSLQKEEESVKRLASLNNLRMSPSEVSKSQCETFDKNHSNQNVDLKSSKCDEITKTSKNRVKQTFRRPTDDAQMEISIRRNNHDDYDDYNGVDYDRSSNFKARLSHHENVNDHVDNKINRNLRDKLVHNDTPTGAINVSNCCNALPTQSNDKRSKQKHTRQYNYIGNFDKILHKTHGKGMDGDHSIEDDRFKDQYASSESCSECCRNCKTCSNENTLEMGKKLKVRRNKNIELKCTGTTMYTNVHEEVAYDPYQCSPDRQPFSGTIFNRDQGQCGFTSAICDNYNYHCNEYRCNLDQMNYDCCSDGRYREIYPCQLKDEKFLKNEPTENKLLSYQSKIDRSNQTDQLSTEENNCSICNQYIINDILPVKDSNSHTNNATKRHASNATIRDTSNATDKGLTRTVGEQTDIIHLINEVTSDTNQNISACNPTSSSRYKDQCHDIANKSIKHHSIDGNNSNNTKRGWQNRRQARADDVYNSGKRIVLAIENELKDIEPYLNRSNGSIVLRLANREINKISDFLKTSNNCNP